MWKVGGEWGMLARSCSEGRAMADDEQSHINDIVKITHPLFHGED